MNKQASEGLYEKLVENAGDVVMPGGSVSHWIANGDVVDVEHKRLLMAICRDVSESVNLKSELVNRNKALAALSQVAVALSSCSDLDEGLSQALDQILSALGLRIGAIILKDAEGKLRIGATSAPDLEALSAKAASAGKLVSLEAMERGEWILVPNLFDETVDPLIQELSHALGVEAFVSVPLLSKDNVKAALSLGVPPPADLSPDQTEFIQLAAGILGPAIENAALHADLTDRVDRLAMLERLARSRPRGGCLKTGAASAGAFTYLLKPVIREALIANLGLASARAMELGEAHKEAQDLQAALEVRKLSERAKYVLMARLSLNEADAFSYLKQKCRNQNKTLRQASEEILAADEAFLAVIGKEAPKKARTEGAVH